MKIVMLCGKGCSSLFMYNGIKDDFKIDAVIQEVKPSIKKLVKRRIKNLGFIEVLNQSFFQILIPRILTLFSKRRISEIKIINNLKEKPVPQAILTEVASVNDKECLDLIIKIQPDIIIVNGTRIIGKRLLEATKTLFINTHVGITPEYRGVHGGYWALRNDDIKNCGVTIHKVDVGIDTGDIISQNKIEVTNRDNFVTYPFLQISKAIVMMKEVLITIENDQLRTYKKEGTSVSKLWYHPTLTGYLYHIIFKGIK